eukprot:141485_1
MKAHKFESYFTLQPNYVIKYADRRDATMEEPVFGKVWEAHSYEKGSGRREGEWTPVGSDDTTPITDKILARRLNAALDDMRTISGGHPGRPDCPKEEQFPNNCWPEILNREHEVMRQISLFNPETDDSARASESVPESRS